MSVCLFRLIDHGGAVDAYTARATSKHPSAGGLCKPPTGS